MKLLIVEDDTLMQECWCDRLISAGFAEGYDFLFVENFIDARTAIEAFKPQVVATDHHLRGVETGIDVCNLVRTRYPDTKLIRVSSFNESGYPNGILYISKFELRDAVKAIQETLT